MNILLRFYLPLALPAVLVGISHMIVSWVLTRMENASLVLSAYALALGVAQLGEAPLLAARQAAMTLVKSQAAWRTVRMVAWSLSLLVLAVELLSAWGPLSHSVMGGVFRVPDELMAPTLTVFRLYLFLVVVSTWRFLHQGVVIGQKRPIFVTLGMVIRLPFQVLLAYGTVQWGWLPPLLAGPGILLSAIFVEAVVAFVGSVRILPTLPEAEGAGELLTSREAIRFFLPLAGSFFVYATGRPAINAALGTTPHAEPALAVLSIIYILFFVFLGPLQVLHQVVVVFQQERRRTFRFSLAAGLVASALLLLLGFTGGGQLILNAALEVPEHLEDPLLTAVRVMALWPLFYALGDYLQGILLLERNTRPIGLAKFAGLLVSVGMVRLLVGAAGSPSATVAIAVLGLAAGAAAEALVMYGLRHLSNRS